MYVNIHICNMYRDIKSNIIFVSVYNKKIDTYIDT